MQRSFLSVSLRTTAMLAIVAAASLSATAACDKKAEAKPEAAATVVAPASSAADSKVDAKAPSFTLNITPLKVAVGEKGTSTLTITPAKGFKVNKDYPTKITLEKGTKVDLAQLVYKKADTKIADGALTVALGATGKAAGQEAIKVKAKFSVCNDTTCLLETASVTIQVAVK